MRGIGFLREYRSLLACRLTAILILLIIESQIQAFSSLTKADAGRAFLKKPATGYVHGELTRVTMCALNLRNDFVVKVVEVNWRIDWDSNSRDIEAFVFGPAKVLYRPNNKYKPEHHFDRNKEDRITVGGRFFPDHLKPFARGLAYLQSRRVIIVDGLIGRNGKNTSDVQLAAGQALHAMQDFFAHSNVTDLTEVEWNQVMRSLELVSGPVGPLPMTLKIAGFDKHINGDFEKPDPFCLKDPLRPYGHDACAKDANEPKYRESNREMEADAYKFVPGKTKFVRAREAAIEFSIKWLQAVKTEVGAVNWRKIENDGTSPCQLNFAFIESENTVAALGAFGELLEFEAVQHGNWLAAYRFDQSNYESY